MAEKQKPVDDGKVEVFVPRSGTGTEEQLLIGINGVMTIIPKGQRVRVSPAVAEEVERSIAAEERMYRNKEDAIRLAAEGSKR